MFEKIPFTNIVAKNRLLSKNLTKKDYENPVYNKENLMNSKFVISGSADSFQMPPITDFAVQNLFHVESFMIFHYGFDSFTERQNFHSFLIMYTYFGQGILTYQGKNYTLKEGDGAFINCMDYHLYKADRMQWDTAVLHLNGPLLAAFHAQYMQNGSPVFHEETNGSFQKILEHLLKLYSIPHLYRDWQASTCIDNMLNHLLLLTAPEEKGKINTPEYIRYLIKYMENNYTQKLTLDYLAEFACMNKYYLSKEFKKYTGFSPNDYLISLRINRAKQLLEGSSLPASKIAHEAGIHDINNFTNLFKKKTGMTPIQYRTTAQEISIHHYQSGTDNMV